MEEHCIDDVGNNWGSKRGMNGSGRKNRNMDEGQRKGGLL